MRAKNGERLDLIRALGPWAAAAIVIGTMVGTGIFLKPGEMAAVGGSVSVVYAAWIVGGLLSLFGALSFAELGAALAGSGRAVCLFAQRARARVGISFWVDAFDSGRIEFGGFHRGGIRAIFQFSDSRDCRADFYVALY